MRVHPTFAAYISRQFLTWWFGIFLILVALIGLFDTIEITRRTASLKNVAITDVMAMVLFKLPHLAQKAIPFTILFGGMMTFWRLNRHHELVVARSSGVSAWEFLTPVLVVAALIGVVKITVYSPFASAMMFKYEQLEARYFKGDHSLAAISGKGLWLRQPMPGGNYILHASKITPSTMSLQKVIIFQFRGTENFISRLDADAATLGINQWHLENVRVTAPEKPLKTVSNLSIPTNLTLENIQDSFAKPETMSFWALPGFIEILEKAGFSGLRHRLYWHSQLADPALLCAMILFAAGFTMRPARRGGATGIVIVGVATGVLIYFTTDVAYALGLSSRLPVFLAAWSPATVGCLLGAGLLFHLEDG
ncbi:MAG: LPS export ABC transporter permease LptG [Rhodospirillaceae bacterium]|nr:LPS export ABC transporter permease LptG [Rhodospirillaceae bacterium]|tara:strand:+ start:359 stop:1453 length:1095 start_codon:yes stop_codon:yes gene_type:complete